MMSAQLHVLIQVIEFSWCKRETAEKEKWDGHDERSTIGGHSDKARNRVPGALKIELFYL